MTDRLFTNAVDLNGDPLCLRIEDGRFAEIGTQCQPRRGTITTDLNGALVLPGLVDGHIHLDKSFVGDRWRPHEPTANRRERLVVERRLLADAQPTVQRANALIAQAVSYGTLAMRCHVDVDATTGLDHLHAVMEARDHWRDQVRIELVAFPQAGVVSCPGTADLLDAALSEGAEAVGGIDPTTMDGDANGQLDILFDLAEKHQVRIDIHLHEPGEQGIANLNEIARRTRALGLEGRVAVSHAYALGEVPTDVVDRTADTLARAGVSIMSNAPGKRPFPPLQRLAAAGVRVFSGNDNIQDSWWPYGNGDMLQRAMLVGYCSGFYTDEALRFALSLATDAPASVIGLEDYGIRVGHEATFLIVDAPNGAAAVANPPAQRTWVRQGEINPPS